MIRRHTLTFRHSRWLHRLINLLQIKRLSRLVLGRFPLVRRLPGGSFYAIRSFESFPVAAEIFKSEAYRQIFLDGPIKSFVDLGCNTGYLAVLLKEKTGDADLQGLLVDANPDVIEEARWHLSANGLQRCHIACGVVGARTTGTEHFFVRDLHISSSAKDLPIPEIRLTRTLTVPCLDLRALWFDAFGSAPIDFIKVDIEGSELDLLDGQGELFTGVRQVMLEWHKWSVEFSQVDQRMRALGFRLLEVVKEDPLCGLALYRGVR